MKILKIFAAMTVSLIATVIFTLDAAWALPNGSPIVPISFIVILALSSYYCSRANTIKKAIARGCFIYLVAVLLMPLSIISLGIRENVQAETGTEELIAAGGSILLLIFSFIWALTTGIIAGILGFFLGRD